MRILGGKNHVHCIKRQIYNYGIQSLREQWADAAEGVTGIVA